MDEKLGTRTEHSKFVAKHRNHVEKTFVDEDRIAEFPPELGVVYKCQELRCGELPTHAHKRRAYLVWCVR